MFHVKHLDRSPSPVSDASRFRDSGFSPLVVYGADPSFGSSLKLGDLDLTMRPAIGPRPADRMRQPHANKPGCREIRVYVKAVWQCGAIGRIPFPVCCLLLPVPFCRNKAKEKTRLQSQPGLGHQIGLSLLADKIRRFWRSDHQPCVCGF